MNVIAKIRRWWFFRTQGPVLRKSLEYLSEVPVCEIEENLRSAGQSEDYIAALIVVAQDFRCARVDEQHLRVLFEAVNGKGSADASPARS